MHIIKNMKSGTCLALLVSMAACGGSGGGGGNAVKDKPDAVSVDKPTPAPIPTSTPTPKPTPTPTPVPAPVPVEKPVVVKMPDPVIKPIPVEKPDVATPVKPEIAAPVTPQYEIGSYDAFVHQEIALMTQYYNEGAEVKRHITNIENIPKNSTAIYKGVVGFGDDPTLTADIKNDTDDIALLDDNIRNQPVSIIENGRRIIKPSPAMLTGEITLKAEFSENSFSGHIGDLKDYKNQKVMADINLHDGLIIANGFRTLNENSVSGAIEYDGELKEIYGGSFNGAFLGDNAGAVEGTIKLLRESDRSPIVMLGSFVAEDEAQK